MITNILNFILKILPECEALVIFSYQALISNAFVKCYCSFLQYPVSPTFLETLCTCAVHAAIFTHVTVLSEVLQWFVLTI